MTAPSSVSLQIPPGNPSALIATAAQLREAAQQVDDLAHRTRSEVSRTLSRAEWTGLAAEAYATNIRELGAREHLAGPAVEDIADAVDAFALALARAQREAQEGIALARENAQGKEPDATTYDTAAAEVQRAWTAYNAAVSEAADRIRSATAALPTRDAARHPTPSRTHTPWFDTVGHWVRDHTRAADHDLVGAGTSALDFLDYLAHHPEVLGRLTLEIGGMTAGGASVITGLAGLLGGTPLVATGGGTLAGLAIDAASLRLILGGLALATAGGAAAGHELGDAYHGANSGSSSASGPFGDTYGQIVNRLGYSVRQNPRCDP